jgi:hypothetical protein
MDQRSKTQSASDVPLIPFQNFRKTAKRILSNSKRESDKQLADFQASNAKKREAKKKR